MCCLLFVCCTLLRSMTSANDSCTVGYNRQHGCLLSNLIAMTCIDIHGFLIGLKWMRVANRSHSEYMNQQSRDFCCWFNGTICCGWCIGTSFKQTTFLRAAAIANWLIETEKVTPTSLLADCMQYHLSSQLQNYVFFWIRTHLKWKRLPLPNHLRLDLIQCI